MPLSLFPKDEKFFELFEQQAQHLCDAAKAFKELTSKWDIDSPLFEEMRNIEHEADITTHEIMDKLNRTFVTPLDREDIHELASEMDDVVDLTESIAHRMRLYRLANCHEELHQLADTLWQATETVKKAIGCLRDPSKSRRLLDYCIEINRLENAGDQLLAASIGKLFANTHEPLEVIKWEKIYEVAETAIDKCENVANTLEGIVVKHG